VDARDRAGNGRIGGPLAPRDWVAEPLGIEGVDRRHAAAQPDENAMLGPAARRHGLIGNGGSCGQTRGAKNLCGGGQHAAA
jgi:hypothetical protein